MPEIQSQSTHTFIGKANGKSRRGFASMDKERHKLVSSKGGKSERRQSMKPKENINVTTNDLN